MPTPPEPARPYAAVDIDGVLADVRHRLRFVASPPKDWDAFFAAAVDDGLLAEGAAVVHQLQVEHEVVYLTGRPERCRHDTVAWLARHGLPQCELVMRSVTDRRPARQTKLTALREFARRRPVALVVDDDAQVVRVLRKAGFAVMQADWMSTDTDPSTQQTLFDAQRSDGRT